MQAKLIRILSALCLVALVSGSAVAQQHRPFRVYTEPDGWSIGMNFGMTDMWGDVGTKTAVDHYMNSKYFDKVAFMGGMFGRYSFHPFFALRFHVNIGTRSATYLWNEDVVKGASLLQGNDYVQRYLRSQTAKTTIIENAFLMEFTPRRFNLNGDKGFKRRQPYLAAGLALFHYTPYSTVADGTTFIKTYELDLEGQGFGDNYPKRSSRWQPSIPLAIGYRWDLGAHLNLGIEYMYRMTMFDYLDGVSGKYISDYEFRLNKPDADATLAMAVADKQQYFNNAQPNKPGTLRGNPSNNDSYSSLTITLAFRVPTRDRIWWSVKQF